LVLREDTNTCYLWDDSGTGNPTYWEKDLSQCHFILHQPNMKWPAIYRGPPRWRRQRMP